MTGETPPAKKSLEILPLEVWSKIFDELESPTDVASCYRTCRDWMTFLEPKRTHFLMPKVLPLIVKYLTVKKENKEEEDDTEDDNSDWEDFDDDDSEKAENPSSNPILRTRLVCKSWKYAVDSLLQNHPIHTNVDLPNEEGNSDPSKTIKALSIKRYKFDVANVNDLENLVETDFPSDFNPFLTRYLHYSEDYEGGANLLGRLRSAFTNLLLLHGTHVWHVSFSIDFPRRGSTDMKRLTEVYNLVHRYLSLMPNLYTLDIYFDRPCSSSYLDRMKQPPEQLLDANPFPIFERLSRLTTLTMLYVPAPIEKEILLRNSHIQKLHVLSDSFAASAAILQNLQMDMLEEFTLEVELEMDLLSLQSLSWPVKKLSIGSHNLSLDLVFRAISASCFANNLKRLVLEVTGDDKVNKLMGKLELPNLITFQIRVEDMPLKSIDFLLPTSPSLSTLQIEMKAEQESTQSMTKEMRIPSSNQVVQFYDYIPKMLESNIWNHFHKLKRLEILKYNPNHDRHFSYSCCGKEPGEDHFKNEKYGYTRGE